VVQRHGPGADGVDVYAGKVAPTASGVPRWSRGCAVALVTAPGVLLAHLATAGSLPSPLAALLVCAVAAVVAGVLPAGGAGTTAVVAAVAQLAGHAVLAFAVPSDAGGTGCLSVVGRGAEALVHPASACPPGTVPVSPAAATALTAVLAAAGAAALVLAGSGLLAVVAAGAVAAIATGVAAVRAQLLGVVLVLADPAALRMPVRRVVPAPAPAPVPLRSVWRPGAPARRGPPAVPAAA